MADIPGNTSSRVALPIGRNVTGEFETENDADWYRVSLDAGTNYTFRAVVAGPGDVSADVTLRNASGRVVADSDSSEYDSVVGGFDYRPTAGGTFFFAVKAFDGPGSHTVAFEEDEPGGPPTPARIEPGQTLERDFFSGDDSDTFSIQLEQGKAYDFGILNDPNAGVVASNLQLLDDGGRVLFDSYDLDEPVSDLFEGERQLFNDFRAPYSGTFFLRADNIEANQEDYSLAAAADPAAGPFDPGAPPSGEDDLLLGGAVATDRINALAGDDLVYGRGGNDDLQGGAGTDAVLGGAGKDFVYGGPGDDRLYGDAGDDKLGGDRGVDIYTGGAGRDLFDMSGRPEGDFITDFAKGTDKIDLRKVDANSAIAGDQAFTFVGERQADAAGQLYYEYDEFSDVTRIRGRVSDSSSLDIRLSVDGDVTLAASDFAL